MPFPFSIDFSKIRARLVRATWSKTSKTEKDTKTQKKPHSWLSPSFGAGSTDSVASSINLNTPRRDYNATLVNLSDLNPSWSSRRKSSLKRLSARNMGFVEEVRSPRHEKEYQYVPLLLDYRPGLEFHTNYLSSEGIEMELDADLERRGSMPQSPMKPMPMPAPTITPRNPNRMQSMAPPPLPPRNPARQAIELERTPSFRASIDSECGRSPTRLSRSISRRSKPLPISINHNTPTERWLTPPLCESPEKMSVSQRRSLRHRSELLSPTAVSKPLLVLRPSVGQGFQCVISDTPFDILLDTPKMVGSYPETPGSAGSRWSVGSRSTAARWFGVSRTREDL